MLSRHGVVLGAGVEAGDVNQRVYHAQARLEHARLHLPKQRLHAHLAHPNLHHGAQHDAQQQKGAAQKDEPAAQLAQALGKAGRIQPHYQ